MDRSFGRVETLRIRPPGRGTYVIITRRKSVIFVRVLRRNYYKDDRHCDGEKRHAFRAKRFSPFGGYCRTVGRRAGVRNSGIP